MNVFEQVEKNIDDLVEKSVDWAACATEEQLRAARAGNLKIPFFDREIPKEWLKGIKGKKVLCLAGAGGLQAPLFACAGAEVTVLDISKRMLDKDREVSERNTYPLRLSKEICVICPCLKMVFLIIS